MDIQYLLVLAIVAAALIFAGATVIPKRRLFSPKPGCGEDCGCKL